MSERDRPVASASEADSVKASDAAYSEEARERQLVASQSLAGWPPAELPEHVRGLPQIGQLRPIVHDSEGDH